MSDSYLLLANKGRIIWAGIAAYTVSDDNGHTMTATVSITITASPEAGKCVAIQNFPDTGTKQIVLNKFSGSDIETETNLNVIESTKTTFIREVFHEFNGQINFSIIREEFRVDNQYIYEIKISSKSTSSRNNEIVGTTIDASTLSPGSKFWNSSVCEGQKITHSYTRTGTSTFTTQNTDPTVIQYNQNRIETTVIEAVNESKTTLAGTFNTYRTRETNHISGKNNTSFSIIWRDILTGILVAQENHSDDGVGTNELIQLTLP